MVVADKRWVHDAARRVVVVVLVLVLVLMLMLAVEILVVVTAGMASCWREADAGAGSDAVGAWQQVAGQVDTLRLLLLLLLLVSHLAAQVERLEAQVERLVELVGVHHRWVLERVWTVVVFVPALPI